jgi:hypothetical protein
MVDRLFQYSVSSSNTYVHMSQCMYVRPLAVINHHHHHSIVVLFLHPELAMSSNNTDAGGCM